MFARCAMRQPATPATWSSVAAASSIGGFPWSADGRTYSTTPRRYAAPAHRTAVRGPGPPDSAPGSPAAAIGRSRSGTELCVVIGDLPFT